MRVVHTTALEEVAIMCESAEVNLELSLLLRCCTRISKEEISEATGVPRLNFNKSEIISNSHRQESVYI